jgi:hypothetical protein
MDLGAGIRQQGAPSEAVQVSGIYVISDQKLGLSRSHTCVLPLVAKSQIFTIPRKLETLQSHRGITKKHVPKNQQVPVQGNAIVGVVAFTDSNAWCQHKKRTGNQNLCSCRSDNGRIGCS